jgi:hypothetical protein
MSLEAYTTDSNDAENTTNDADDVTTGRLAYEAYAVVDDLNTVLNRLLGFVSEHEYAGDDVPDDHPLMEVVAVARDAYSGAGSLGDAVGDGRLTFDEFTDAQDDTRVGCTTLNEGRPDFADGLDVSGDRLIPVIDGEPMSLTVRTDEDAQHVADALNGWVQDALNDDTPLPDFADDGTGAESDDEDDNPLENKWKDETVDAGDTTDTDADDAGGDSTDMTQKEAVYETCATADAAFQRAVIDSADGYRNDVVKAVQERHGMNVSKNYAGKQAQNWASVADVDVATDADDGTPEEDEEDEETAKIEEIPPETLAKMTAEQIAALQ